MRPARTTNACLRGVRVVGAFAAGAGTASPAAASAAGDRRQPASASGSAKPPSWYGRSRFVGRVEDLLAVDLRLQHLRVDGERRPGEDHEVGVLALLQRAEAVVEVHHLRRRAASAPCSAAASVMPPRTAMAPVRRKNRDSVMQSSVLIATVTPALSRMAAFSSSRPIVSALPPGLSTSVSDTGIFFFASTSATR